MQHGQPIVKFKLSSAQTFFIVSLLRRVFLPFWNTITSAVVVVVNLHFTCCHFPTKKNFPITWFNQMKSKQGLIELQLGWVPILNCVYVLDSTQNITIQRQCFKLIQELTFFGKILMALTSKSIGKFNFNSSNQLTYVYLSISIKYS